MEADRFLKLLLLFAGLFTFFNSFMSISLPSRTRLSSSSLSEGFLSSYYLIFSLANDEGTCGMLLKSIFFFVVGVPLFMQLEDLENQERYAGNPTDSSLFLFFAYPYLFFRVDIDDDEDPLELASTEPFVNDSQTTAA